MKLRRSLSTIYLILLYAALPACSTLAMQGKRTIKSNPPPSPAEPLPPSVPEPLDVGPDSGVERVSDPKNVIRELSEENCLTHIPKNAPNESGP